VKKNLFIAYAFTALCSAATQNATAQRGWELGGWLGTAHYFGDLNTSFSFMHPGFAGGAIGRYNFNDRLCAKMSLNYGLIGASDAYSSNDFEKNRNLSFKSNIFDGTAQFEFNFLPYNHGSREEFFTPYLFAGFSLYYSNPQANLDGKWYDLRGLGTEGQFRGDEYYSTQGALAYGGGFKIDITPVWSLNLEMSCRKLYTDYLDDVSSVYANKNDLLKLRGATAVALSDRSLKVNDQIINQTGRQRGDSKNADMYLFLQVGIVRYFGNLRCPGYGGRK
jgi:Outer membrane protein beta-barrel domain